jgi:selenocysteine lyase/cysteine desulfurase
MQKVKERISFEEVRKGIVGVGQELKTPYGVKPLIYADWTASGRLYRPIEEKILHEIGPYVANTHTETSFTGATMTHAYHEARQIIKQHVNAGPDDVLITCGSGMTAAVTKFQRILGLKICDRLRPYTQVPDSEKPIVFITHMEHHSNHTSWLETIADVVLIEADADGLVDLNHFANLLDKHRNRAYKIASVTGGSNVTGIRPDYHSMAEMIHEVGGLCFVDFACAGPYVDMDMHPADRPNAWLDAIYFSPHKFLGGPGTPGVLVFNRKLYKNVAPDMPGGGTVTYTNPWGEHYYIDDIETREDGGTPAFIQTIRAALSIQLKEEMGITRMWEREHELLQMIFSDLDKIQGLRILAGQHQERLGVVSFFIEGLHFNLGVKLLNDHFGIQVRGGCSCAGTYGHYLLEVDQSTSHAIYNQINSGKLSEKPGWIRMSIHPTTTDEEAKYICEAIRQVAVNHQEWGKDYQYDIDKNEFFHKDGQHREAALAMSWFS